MTDHEKTSDAVKITKHLYGEPSQESRNELAADDLHEKLVAACEAVGMEAYSDDTTLDGEKRLPFSAPFLCQRLERWCRGKHGWMKMVASPETGQCYVWWENLDGVALGGAESKDEETARMKAVIAAVEKIREQK